MNAQAVTRLLERLVADETFAVGLVEAVGGRQGEAAIEAVVAYGNENGFPISAIDAAELQRHLIADAELLEGDLDDDDLDAVAGGVLVGMGFDPLQVRRAAEQALAKSLGRSGNTALDGFIKQW
ncbi:hypothetical protein [Nisaea sp.]|uniref:hypothetical protein n=1 Tax=Nisaea sp. TaxID=2024842 RepID=UPI003B52A78E